MAHTKAKSAAKNNRESEAKRLGVKRQNGEAVASGEVIVRQRGTKFYPGFGVRRGGDDTLYAAHGGVVNFKTTRKIAFDGRRKSIRVVSIV